MIPGRRWLRIAALIAFAVVAANGWLVAKSILPRSRAATPARRTQRPAMAFRPRRNETLQLIQRGGPFPYERDGARLPEPRGRLPAQPAGYYREYTVPTPGARDRGARRIVTGGDPPRVFYYTDDHYRTFRRIEVEP